MKKWAITDLTTNQITQVYLSEEVNYKRFGGPAGNRNKCGHIQVSDAAVNVAVSDLEIKTINVQTGTQQVPDGDPQPAKDSDGNPMQDENGDPIMVQDYKEEPIIESLKRAVQKS